MTHQVKVGVYRRLDNRFEGLDDQSPRGRELHKWRKNALHGALDGDPDIVVLDWGKTNDTQSHELVDLILQFVSDPAVSTVASAALGWVAARIGDAVNDIVVDGAKKLIQKFLPYQKSRRILDFHIELSNGAVISVRPQNDHATISLSASDGSVTVSFDDIPEVR